MRATLQVSDASMLALRHQRCLTDLDLHDCIKLTDEGIACLQGKTTQQQTANGLIINKATSVFCDRAEQYYSTKQVDPCKP